MLVGPPGVGQDVGRRCAGPDDSVAGCGTPTHDIEATAGRPIPDIFVTDGEPAFRAMERGGGGHRVDQHDGVLTLGGGSILAEQTRTLLPAHTVVFLSR